MRIFIDLEKARKLHGKLEFQDLPISVENRAGSRRYWYDPNSDEHGSTKMKYPYGYIRGTSGMDGDEVDVFVGPDTASTTVFVVTQMKRPEFTEVDEQKVMLGFTSAKEAKRAYLEHYNDPKFFGSMKEFTIDEFKQRLKTFKGKLIKHLYFTESSAKLAKAVIDKDQDMEQTKKSCEHSKSITCEKCNNPSATDLLKALTARMLSMSKIQQEHAAAVKASREAAETPVEDSKPPVLHANDRPFEPPSTRIGVIPTPPVTETLTLLSPDFLTSCTGCGYTHKSLSNCPRCASVAAFDREALPIWRR